MQDTRKPSLVTADFHARLHAALEPHGFAARKKALVRRRGESTHRIELSSSHHNAPGFVTQWIALVVKNAHVRRIEPEWSCGGSLGSEEFREESVAQNIADSAQADALVELVIAKLAFFDRIDDPEAVLADACLRYVPGMISPRVVVPYLHALLGEGAARTYAEALLRGRPELSPAYEGTRTNKLVPQKNFRPDHGSELATALAKHGVAIDLAFPKDTVTSTDPAAANLRCFFGRQLRAWGERDAAGLLRRVPDARIKELRDAQEKIPGPIVDDAEYASIVFREVTTRPRALTRDAPAPRFFQYHVLAEPFA